MNLFQYIAMRPGEVYALATAFTWATAVILFKKSGESVHPIALNQFKNVLALFLLVPTMLILSRPFLPAASTADYLVLLCSGALGIGVADTLFFHSLNMLGAGRSAIVECLYSPFIIALSMFWLGESLSLVQGAGALLIVSAVLAISGERHLQSISRKQLLVGVLLGVLAMAAMAVGIVFAKPVLDRSDLFWVTFIRFIGGVGMLFLMLMLHPDRIFIVRSLAGGGHRSFTLAGAFIGGYLSMLLWLSGMKYTQASIAAALNQTSNILIFILAAVFLREKITVLRLAAILTGVCGAVMVGAG